MAIISFMIQAPKHQHRKIFIKTFQDYGRNKFMNQAPEHQRCKIFEKTFQDYGNNKFYDTGPRASATIFVKTFQDNGHNKFMNQAPQHQRRDIFIKTFQESFFFQGSFLPSTVVSSSQMHVSWNGKNRDKCYKTFYARNFLMFVIRRGVCPWQVFHPSLTLVSEAGAFTSEASFRSQTLG
jgi:hypothetical protein